MRLPDERAGPRVTVPTISTRDGKSIIAICPFARAILAGDPERARSRTSTRIRRSLRDIRSRRDARPVLADADLPSHRHKALRPAHA